MDANRPATTITANARRLRMPSLQAILVRILPLPSGHRPDKAIIDTTPAGRPVVEALACLAPGGRLVINAIRKEEGDKGELARLDYDRHLWQEKEIKSVANVTRRDVREFLALAGRVPLRPEVEVYPLAEANRALLDLRFRPTRGAKVLRIDPA